MADDKDEGKGIAFAEYLKITNPGALSKSKMWKEIQSALKNSSEFKGLSTQEAFGKWKDKTSAKNDTSKSTSTGSTGNSGGQAVTVTRPDTATANAASRAEISAPQIVMHVPSPTVHIEANQFPGWFAIAERLSHAALLMIAGAAMHATFGARALRMVAGF